MENLGWNYWCIGKKSIFDFINIFLRTRWNSSARIFGVLIDSTTFLRVTTALSLFFTSDYRRDSRSDWSVVTIFLKFIRGEEFQRVGKTIFIKPKIFLFPNSLIISTQIFKMFTFLPSYTSFNANIPSSEKNVTSCNHN